MSEESKKHKLELWAAIASSIAAVVSMVLLIYQLCSDNPKLDIQLKGAAFADYESEIYISTWISAFNKGKRPIGIIEANLNISFPDRTKIEVSEIPVFPRFSTENKSNAPAIEVPFFFEPTYYDSFIKDKSGKELPFDYHPHKLEYTNKTFNIGDYHVGYIIFKLNQEERKKFLQYLEKNHIFLLLKTTDKKIKLPIHKINKWEKETFGKRFIIIASE